MESASEHSSRLRELRRLPASSRVKTTTRADGQQATGAGSASGEPGGRDLLDTWPGRGAALVEDVDDGEVPLTVEEEALLLRQCRLNKVELVEKTIDSGKIGPNFEFSNGDTVLIIACKCGYKKLALAVMQRGANMDLRDPEGNTAAHWAFAMGFNDLADFILAKGANDRIANNQGFTCRNWRRPEPCDGRSYTVAVGVPLVEPGPGWGAPRKPVPQEGLGPCEKDAQASVTRVSSRSAHSPQNEALQDPLATLRARVSELEESNARLEKANHLVQQEKQIVQTEKDELARHNTELQSKLSALEKQISVTESSSATPVALTENKTGSVLQREHIPADLQTKNAKPTDSAAGGDGEYVGGSFSGQELEEGTQNSTAKVVDAATEQVVKQQGSRQSVVSASQAATDEPGENPEIEGRTNGTLTVEDLASRLAAAIEQEKLTVEEAFDAIAQHYGEMSLFDLAAAIARVNMCGDFMTVEKLFERFRSSDSVGAGIASKAKWCSVLGKVCESRVNLETESETSIDMAKGDADLEEHSYEAFDTGRGRLYRSPEERKSRTLCHFSVALAVQCKDSLMGIDFFAKDKIDFPASDLHAIVREWQLDLSATDVDSLVSELFPTETRVSKSNWDPALAREVAGGQSLIKILTGVASAMLWDVRTPYNTFLSKVESQLDRHAKATLVPQCISKIDLVELNDTWQFCLSEKELDLWFRYLDSSHTGRIPLQSWLRSLQPFYAAINAMSQCLHRLNARMEHTDPASSSFFDRFDRNKNGELTPEELMTYLKDTFKSEVQEPDEQCHETHMSIFHQHLTYFTDGSDNDPAIVHPSYWSAGFDLIECSASMFKSEKNYSKIFDEYKRAIAIEQVAALALSRNENVLQVLTKLGTEDKVDVRKFLGIDSDTSVGVQWQLLRRFGEAAPQIDAHGPGFSCPEFLQDVASAVVTLRNKMAVRGASLLGVLLASHKISIEVAFDAFRANQEHITFSRFREIMRRLAPDFGAESPRIESLFLSLCDLTHENSKDKPHVCKAELEKVLKKTAGRLSNKHLERVLMQTSSSDQQESEKDGMTGGERQRLRDVFFDSKSDEHPAGVDKSDRLEQNSLFINNKQLRRSLSKLGVFVINEVLEDGEPVIKKRETEKLRVNRRRFRRGDWNSKLGEDRSEDLRNAVTLWKFEREVERSRLSSTFEKMKLHSVFADALCDEMQPEKGMCTPLALHQLQSTHLMSWMLSLGEKRLKELLGRTYDLKRGDIVEKVASGILQFHTRQGSQTNMSMNSKYSTWAGTFGSKLRKGRFGKLDDFKKGLDVYLGMPSFNVKAAMEREHCAAHDSYTKFSPSNNQDMNTWPQMEWDFVVNYDPTKEYPGAGERVGQSLHFYLTHDNAKEACLTETEVIGLRLYSGPMFMHYNMVLRQQTGKQYITTIHAIVSGIIKLSSIMKLPLDRKVYRGLSGVELPEEFWHADKYGAKGGVEMGIMSTTRRMGVAVQYSSYGQVPTVFEIEIGQVDRGAELRWISQFPGEDEVVMPPLSNLEVVGDPYLRCLEDSHTQIVTQILIVPLRVNVNIKSKTMEELESTRKDVLLSGIAEMQSEAEQEVSDLAQSMGEITALAAGQAPEWFNDQVAHLEVKDEHSSDSRNKELVLRRRRSDLLELVAARVNKSTTMQKDQGPAVRIRHVTNTIISLERETWYARISSRESSAISKRAQCEEYRRKNALELDVASSLCKDLGKDLLQTDDLLAAERADGSDDFLWVERLMLYTNSVNALDMCVGKGDVIAWREGDCRPAIPAANRCRATFCEHAFDQHALQVRVTVEVQGESCLAVGVFSEEVFKKWQNGDWSLNLPESQLNDSPIMQVDGGVVIAIRTPAAGGDGGKREEREEREREKRKKEKGGKRGKEGEEEGEKRERRGGEGKRERGEEGCPSREASFAMNEIVQRLTRDFKDAADDAYQALDVDKDGKISLADLEAAKIRFALSDCNMAALLLELAGSKDSFISRDVWENLIEASRMESINVRAQKFAQLDTRTALNVEFDCVRNRIFFSTGPTEKHDATLNFHDCRAKFYVAAVFLGGESICKVQIASAPMLTFRDSQMEKPEADKFLERFQACPMESTGQTDAKLNHTFPKAALENLKHLLKQGVEATDATKSDANDEEGEKAAKPMLQNVAKPVGEAPVNEQGNDSSDTAGQRPVTTFSFVVGGKFYDELVKKVGEGRARTEFILMLVTWKTQGYPDLEPLKDRAMKRADIIADCRSSLKSVYGAYVDDNAKASRELAYKQGKAILTSQEAILKFFKDSTHRRVSGVQSFLNHVASEPDENDFGKPRLLPKLAEIAHRMRKAFQGLLCIEIAMSKSISQSLLKVVASIFENVDGKWREAAKYFGPEMEVLEQIDVLVKRISCSLHALQQTADTFEQLTLDVRSFNFMREETSRLEMDLNKAYELGGVEAKRMQANDRSKSAKECFTRLLAPASDNMHSRDLIWMCDESMQEETWMYDAKLYDADHADTCLAWLDRQCVSSELMRMVERLDDDTLQQAHCQRRFVAILNAVEVACKVLPLTSSESSGIATKRRFESVKRELDRLLKGAQHEVHARLDAGKARIQRRWHIEPSVNEKSKHDGSQAKDAKGKNDKTVRRVDAHDTAADGNKASSWEFKRAESRYWQSLVLLYLQELTKSQSDRLKRDLPEVKRRSVMRCLELLDDSVYHVSAMEGEASSLLRPDAGAVAELNLDDAADEWEARLLGMLSLRHASCKWSLDNAGTPRELHLIDIACGERKELSLCEPESKTAAFVASFVACSSPTSVRILIRDREGKPSTMEDRPIVLVSGGGLTAHISTSESGLKMLDFSGAGLTLHGLRLLVESARADGDIIEATIAGENELDLSEETQELYANDYFARKSVIEDMRFQTNNFGQKHSEESIAIICNIVAVSAQQLRNLNLSKNRLTSAGARVLARFLARGGALALNRLDLSENDLEDDGVEYLSMALQSKHQHISFLDIARTGFRLNGALHLAEAIQSEACLVTNLVLTGNLVGDAGLVALSAALAGKEKKTMKSLTLADNQIGDIGVEAMTYNWTGDEKGSLYSLTALDLSENDITLLGSQKLFVSLEKCAPVLSVLYLSSNRIVHKGIERIAQLLPSCPECLQSLCLETQRPPHAVSESNQHQLLVKTDVPSSDLCITEQEAKNLALDKLRSSKILKNHLSKMMSGYCGPAKDHVQTQARIAKHLHQTMQDAEKDWKRDTSARSAAMQLLKELWRKAGKPLSHLNRHDLSLQREKALTTLVQCSGDMRSREAKHYLSDLSYTKALTTSLDAKQKCVEDFRQNLFSSLMQPLRAMPGAEHQDDKDKVTAATEAATRILEQEVKCRSLNRVVEFQRLLGQKQRHQDAVTRARVANCSASVTSSLVRDVLEAETVFEAKWSSQIPQEHRAGLSRRVLEEVVQQTMCGPLSALDSAAMKLLREKDDQRKKEAVEQEEKADTGHAFVQAIKQIEGFQQSLRLVIADEGNRTLVRDLCYSHYDLNCAEQEVQGDSAGQGAAVNAAADPAATDKVKSIPELVITRGDAAQKVPGKRLSTEEEVMSLFEQNAGLKGTWADHPELTELWDVRSGEGGYANTFPMGSPDYWREVGWLVTRVHEVEGPLRDAHGRVAQERALVWTNLQKRWGPDLKDFSVAPVEDRRDQTTQKVIELHDQMKQKVVDLYKGVHCDLIKRAHALCSGLDDMWDKYPHSPWGLVRDGFERRIGGDRGRLAKFLETHRMLTMVLGVMSASGLKWANTGATQPAKGRILENSELAEALARKTEFTEQEWESFGIKYLSEDAYIQSGAGGSYFKPEVGAASDDSVKQEQLEAIVKEMRDVCSEQLRVLTADYFAQKTDAFLRQPLRLAKTRIEAVRQHISGLFKAETASGGEAKAGRFASAALEGLLAATAQHARDLGRLASMERMLPLDWPLSYPPVNLALTIMISEHPHVLNHTKVLQGHWCDLCREDIQSDGYQCSEGCNFDVCMKCAKPLAKTLIGDVKEVASAELSLPVALAASAPVLSKKVFFKRKAIEINPPESVPPGSRWKEVGMEKPTTGAEIENPELAAALEQKSEFGQRELDAFKVDNLSCGCYIKVGDKYFTPAATRSYSSVKKDDPAGKGNARSRLGSPHAWFPARNADGAWMQMDLGVVKRVAGVVTQGAAEGTIVEHQYVREIAVEYRAQEDQAWLTSSPSCFTCKSGDEKVEHVFSAPVEARYIKISVKAWHLGIGMRAGALEEPSQITSGTIILSDLRNKRCLVSFPARSLRWEAVGAEKPKVGAEIKHESLAAALERTVNFSAEEWDKLQVAELRRDSFMAVGGKYFRPDHSAYVEGETQWCPAEELVDARATELVSLPPAQLARELSQLKHLYREGGAAAKGKQAYAEAIKRVGKLLDDEAKMWVKTCEDRKGKESAAGSKLTQLYSEELHSEHACQDWVRCVANSPSGAYMQHFWNLDLREPKGLLCAMDSDKNETLQRFVNAAGKAIDKRIEDAKVHYQYASGLKWQKCAQPANGHHLAKSELAGELTRKTEFTQQEWDVFGISDLRMDHFVKSGDCYFKPAQVLDGDFPQRIEFVHHKSDGSNEGKQNAVCKWEETEDGVVLSSGNSVATGTNWGANALGTGVAAGGTVVFTLTEKRGQLLLGLALEGFEWPTCGSCPWGSDQTILWYSTYGSGESIIRGEEQEELPCLKEGDVVRVEYNERSQVSFFVNKDVEPMFTVDDIAGEVRPLFCWLGGEVAVSLRFEARETKQSLVVTCQKKEEQKEESAAAQSTRCCAQHPCSRCDAVKHALMDGLVLDFGVALRECAQSVAAAENQAAIWQVFGKASGTILPAASEENDANGRVQAALNRLPAALLAEPQCCRRMVAAVSCLAAASCELPVASTALTLRTRFLVPPFETLADSPSLLRCVELLEQGCASKFNGDSTRLTMRWDREDNPGKQYFDLDPTTNAITYLQNAPDYCNVLSDKPITRGRHTFEFVMHKIGDEQWTGVTADQTLAGTRASLRRKARCWTYYCGRRYHSNGMLSEEREETKELEHIKDSDVIGLTVDFTKRTLGFFTNGVFQADCSFPADVKELYLITHLDAPHDCVELRCTTPQADEDRAVTKLSQDRATETLPPQVLRDMSTWEARLFASLCVSPYTLAAPSGDLALQQLAGGELRDVTLRAADVASQDAAFLAHFVARCCKYPVRVRIVREGRRDAAQYLTLSPGGGLAGHIRKDTAQAAASAADRVLFLASMDVDMAALHLLMEAALAGLREGGASTTLNLGGSEKKDDHTASPEKQGKAPSTSAQFTELLETTAQSIQSLAASKTLTEGQETIVDKDAVQAIELNQNPLIGVGKGTAMKLIVQLAHLAAGRHLLRLHLDNNNIEDAGIQILADSFIKDGFAPRLQILWLHKNCITDVGAKALSTALESSLECVTELCIFSNNFTIEGKATLSEECSRKGLTLHL